MRILGVVSIGAVVLSAAFCSSCGGGHAGLVVEQPGFKTDIVASGFQAPTAFAFLPDGRILVAEQAGVVRLVDQGKVAAKPFIDIHRHVNSFKERGLLGLAVDPSFTSNRFVYLLYAYENNPARPLATKTARLTRVTATGDVASPKTEVALVGKRVGPACKLFPNGSDCIPNDWKGHSVGDIVFARDGTLFLSTGDASNWYKATPNSLRSQNLDSLAGKILHVTRTGKGVPGNPFWNGNPDANRSKVWAYGMRNPFRFALSPGTGLPFVGDVGWNTYEEIDVAAPGSDLGWPCYEGTIRQPEFAPLCASVYARGRSSMRFPLVEWRRQGIVRAAVIGGSFAPAAFSPTTGGAYFYADFVRRQIDYLQVDPNDHLVSGPWRFASGVDGPVDIQFGPDGALYYLSVTTGELRRIRYAPSEATAPGPQRLLGRPTVIPTGTNPHSIATADVNRDGILDLIVANAGSNDVAVLRGLGGGRFAAAARYRTGLHPKAAIAVDLNGDGWPDIVSGNQQDNTVSVLLGHGDGTFGKATAYPSCSNPHDVAAGDLNRDGHPDLAVACFGGSVVSVLLGRGDGTFERAVNYESGNAPHSIVMRDLNGDGRLDLAVANHAADSVGVLLGRGDGTFAKVQTYAVGSHPHHIAAADLNADGHLDLVTANDGSNDVSVLLGAGDGTFAKASSYPAGSVPKGLALGDLNGDGRIDAVTANTGGNYHGKVHSPLGDTVSVLLGNGGGSFGPPTTYLAGQTPFSVVVADLNGDGRPDLGTANWDGGTVSVIPGRSPR